MDIQWYPGHMTKSKRLMEENLRLVDIIVELLDARIPTSSQNPDIATMAPNKKRIIILNKSDLSDPAINKEWEQYFKAMGAAVITADSLHGKGIATLTSVARDLMKDKIAKEAERGRKNITIRAMVVGIPNVGKSTLINRAVGKSMAKTADRPGVTRGKQWIKMSKDFELLDMPGILWPKFEDPNVGIHLAFTGAIKDERVDKVELATKLIAVLKLHYADRLSERYKVNIKGSDGDIDILESIGRARGFLNKGGTVDIERASIILMDEYRGGKLGLISLERP